MIYEPFSIVVVPFPFTDTSQTKKRPAIVLSTKNHQEQTEHITLLMITSAKHSAWTTDYPIKNLAETGLSVPSIIRQKIFTLDQRLILSKIGCLSRNDRIAVLTLLKKHLQLLSEE